MLTGVTGLGRWYVSFCPRSVSCTDARVDAKICHASRLLAMRGQGDVGPLADQVVALLANLLVLEQLVDGETVEESQEREEDVRSRLETR